MDMDAFVTKNFTLREFIRSDTATRLGIDNTPPGSVLATLVNVLIPSMQDLRDLLGVPIQITSAYRCPQLNAAVHGASTSQHVTGHAADFIAPEFGPPSQVAAYIAGRMDAVHFDQLIMEGDWVHISWAPLRRNEVLTAHFSNGGVSYTRGLA